VIMRIRPYLELIRPPNLVTAAADPLTGFLLAGGALTQCGTIGPLVGLSVCLYAGGIALNDVCDTVSDRETRPERPIPAGKIDRRRAVLLVILLFCTGLATAWIIAPTVGYLATGLIVAIVLYDVVLKKTFAAPAVMGLCRSLNLTLGLCALDPLPSMPLLVLPAALMWLYVSSITFFARTESVVSKRPMLVVGLIGLTTAVAGQGLLHPLYGSKHIEQYFFLIALLAMAVWLGYPAVKNPRPTVVQKAVGAYVIGILLFDASLVWVARGPYAAGFVAALIVPTVLLSRLFRVT